MANPDGSASPPESGGGTDLLFANIFSGRTRIFQRRGANLLFGQNLHENEENLTKAAARPIFNYVDKPLTFAKNRMN